MTLGRGVYLLLTKGSPDMTVAHQSLDARNAKLIRIGVRCSFGCVRHGHDDAIAVDLLVFHRRELLARATAGYVNARAVHLAGDVGKIYPLEKAMSLPPRLCKAFEPQLAVFDDCHLARLEVVHLGETKIVQGYGLAGCGKKFALSRPAHRPEAQRVARDKHPSHRVEKGDIVGSVKRAGHPSHNFSQARQAVAPKPIRQLVHENFSVGIERENIVPFGQQLLSQVDIVGQVAVERERIPLPKSPVVPFEGLGVSRVVLAAGRVSSMANRSLARILAHDGCVLCRVRHAKGLCHAAKVFKGVEYLLPGRVKRT